MKNLTAFAGIALVFIYVIGSGLWVNTGDGWYRSLNQPAWQPPDFIFGIIWPYNFVVLGIAAVTIAQRATTTTTLIYLSFFALSPTQLKPCINRTCSNCSINNPNGDHRL
jgi:tryptophan-rich sensory protein